MGTPIIPELIDAEIEDIINTHINEAFDFLQTISCCSGWSNNPEVSESIGEASDGINRFWVGNPYVTIKSLENIQALGQWLPFVMSKMIRDPEEYIILKNNPEYQRRLSSVGLSEDDVEQLVHVDLEYRESSILISIHLNDYNRTPDEVDKIWEMFKNILIEYKQKM